MKKSILNKLSIVILLVFSILLTSCKKSVTLVNVNVPVTMQLGFTIPAGETTGDTSVTVYCNVDSIIRATNASFNASNIKSATATVVKASLSNTDNFDNFGNVSSLSVMLTSGENPTPITFAQVTNNPITYASNLTIPVLDVELKNYFYTTAYTFTFNSTMSSATYIDLDAATTIIFNIVVGPN